MNYFFKSALFSSILFFSISAAAQKKVISIEYKRGLLPVEQYKGKTNEELQNVHFEPRLLEGITYELLIADQKSHFALKKGMGLKSDARMVNGRYRKKIIVYVNNVTQEKISQEKEFRKPYLISHPFKSIDWKLTNEHKSILGHRSRKAIGKKQIHYIKEDTIGKREQLFVAWYAEDIPFSFGPEKFNGLPGVILEVIYGRYSYEATDISIHTKPANKQLIKKPTEGIPITHDEMLKKTMEWIKAMKKR